MSLKSPTMRILFTALACLLFLNAYSQSNTLSVQIQKKQGVYLIYPGQIPEFEYEYVETIDAGTFIKNWRCSTLIDKLLKVFKKDDVKADALIFTEDDMWKADAIRFSSENSENIKVKIEQKEGVSIIYPGQTPDFKYEYVETIDAGTFIKNWKCSTLIDKLLKVFKKDDVEADALIFTEDDMWKADAIKILD